MEQLERDRDEEGYERYVTAYVIWGGALVEERPFTGDGEPLDEDPRTFTTWLAEVKAAARADDADVEVYILEHGHPVELAEECTCAMYLTDHHHPHWSSRDE